MHKLVVAVNTIPVAQHYHVAKYGCGGQYHERDEEAFAIYIFQIVALLPGWR